MTQVYFLIVFLLLARAVVYCSKKYCILTDTSTAQKRRYGWSSVQRAWWIVIILASFDLTRAS
jgi:hypothetical protein